jgi:hypothetical protein
MALKTLAMSLYEVWAYMVCFAKLSPQSFKGSKFPTLRKVNPSEKGLEQGRGKSSGIGWSDLPQKK